MARGLVQGRREEAHALILRLLTHRVGSLPNKVQQQVAQLSLPQLETLGEDLLDFADQQALEAWLEQPH